MHSPTGLPPPVASTYIDPSGGVSVLPFNGPTMFFNPHGEVKIIGQATSSVSTTTSASVDSAVLASCVPIIATMKNGPTISIDSTGGVSIIPATSPSSPKQKTIKTQSATPLPTTKTDTTKSYTTKTLTSTGVTATTLSTQSSETNVPVSISVISGLHTSFSGIPTPKPVTTTDSTGKVHVIPATAFTLTDATGGVSTIPASSLRCGVPVPVQSFTTTLVLPLPQTTASPMIPNSFCPFYLHMLIDLRCSQ